MTLALIFLAVALGAAVVALHLSNTRHSAQLQQITHEAEQRVNALTQENVRLQEQVANLREQQVTDQERKMADEQRFRAIANEVLLASSRQIQARHADSLNLLLKPLGERLDTFTKSVSDCYNAEARERHSLQEQVRLLIENNRNLGNEARELARALRGDARTQGDWGEMLLESILEKSGLRRDEEYFVQVTTDADGRALRDADGRALRPDVVVRYPGGKAVVIDSKVSFTAYIDLVNAGTKDARKEALDRHLRSVRTHIRELAEKKYQDVIGGDVTDFVMMFIPNEGAYVAAMQAQPALWQEAYDKRVLIVSPTHLVSALKLISQLWTHDRQSRNAIAIATEAGRLYDKFAGFVADMEGIQRAIESTQKAYNSAYSKLATGQGNLLRRVEKLREMGAKATKQLPQE